MVLSEKLFIHVGLFNKEARWLVQQIVDEMHMPLAQRLFKPLQHLPPKYQPLYDPESDHFDGILAAGTLVYIYDGIFVKLSTNGEIASRTQRKHVQAWEKTLGSQAPPVKRKQYAREFNANERIFDAIYLTSNAEASYKVRNPLQVLVDYKGFRALATAVMPINPKAGMSLGFDSDGRLHVLDIKLRNELQNIAEVLNLDETKTRVKKSNIVLSAANEDSKVEVDIQPFESLPISNFVKVYEQSEGFIPNLMTLGHN
jgi:hypothetical protein